VLVRLGAKVCACVPALCVNLNRTRKRECNFLYAYFFMLVACLPLGLQVSFFGLEKLHPFDAGKFK